MTHIKSFLLIYSKKTGLSSKFENVFLPGARVPHLRMMTGHSPDKTIVFWLPALRMPLPRSQAGWTALAHLCQAGQPWQGSQMVLAQ